MKVSGSYRYSLRCWQIIAIPQEACKLFIQITNYRLLAYAVYVELVYNYSYVITEVITFNILFKM